MRCVLALALLMPACWTWSFPETLLAPAADAGLGDAGGQMAGQSGTPDGGLDAGSGGSVGDGGGSGGQPNGCQSHADCPSGLCTLAGACAAEEQITYVASACLPTATGARDNPACSLEAALTSARPYVLVAAGIYEATPFDSPRQVYGQPGAIVRAAACDRLTIQGADVSLVGLAIEGNVVVSGNGAKATLVGNSIGPSSCTGVRTSAAARLVMDRNLVHGHAQGGVWTEGLFDLSNNIIVDNGAMNSDLGGARLSEAAGSRFMHNTVSVNHGRNRPFDAGGVECLGAVTVINSIVWGNTSKQLSDGCSPSFTLITDPLFMGGAPGDAATYQLQKGSPAINKGTAGGPSYDFFGATRIDGPDLGAVEFLR